MVWEWVKLYPKLVCIKTVLELRHSHSYDCIHELKMRKDRLGDISQEFDSKMGHSYDYKAWVP